MSDDGRVTCSEYFKSGEQVMQNQLTSPSDGGVRKMEEAKWTFS